MVVIKLSMLTKGSNSVYVLRIMQTPIKFWGAEATEQNLIKLILHLYHEVKSTFSILGEKIFPGKRF